MTAYSTGTTITGPSRGRVDTWLEVISARGGQRLEEGRKYLEEVYRLAPAAGIRADLVVVQAIHETKWFTSSWWVERLNPAGLGITGTPAQDNASRFFPSGVEAARGQIVHLALYGIGRLSAALAPYRDEDPRADAIGASALGKRRTLRELGGSSSTYITWAEDIHYGPKIANHLNDLAGIIGEEEVAAPEIAEEETPMPGMKAYSFVGARREAYLPDWIVVEIKIVEGSRVRSYRKYTHQTKTTYHDTGNPRTKAAGEYAWLAGGRSGGEPGGYNFIFDDGLLIQCTPLDEETWHAGTPEGNRVSWGSEHAFGGGTDWQKSLEIGMALHGALIEMQDLDPDDAAVLHQFWYGKWCSAQILNRGAWPQVKAGIKRYWLAAQAARTGKVVPAPGPTLVKPQPIMVNGVAWDGHGDAVVNGVKFEAQKGRVTVTADSLNGRQWASTDSAFTIEGKRKGDGIDVLGWVKGQTVEGIDDWWVGTDGTRFWAGGIAEERKTTPVAVTMPDKPHGGKQQIVNGTVYYPFGDGEDHVVEVKTAGNVRRWAGTGEGSPVMETVKVGDIKGVAYWCIGEDIEGEKVWYVLDNGQADVIHTGHRMWAGLTDERPD